MAVKVFLSPHEGAQEYEGKMYRYTHDQWMVHFQHEDSPKKFIGYLPKRKDSPFLPAGKVWDSLPAELQMEIREEINLEVGESRPLGTVPLPLSALARFPGNEQEEDEDDDIIVDE